MRPYHASVTQQNDFELCSVGRVPYLSTSLTVNAEDVRNFLDNTFNKYDSVYKLSFSSNQTLLMDFARIRLGPTDFYGQKYY